MGRHGSRRPSINTSADAVLRRLEYEFTSEPSGARELVRAHLRPLAGGAILVGAALVVAAVLAPVLVAALGGLAVAAGVVMTTVVEDADRVTGIARARRWGRRTLRRIAGRWRGRDRRASSTPLGCRVAPWLFPDPGAPGKPNR